MAKSQVIKCFCGKVFAACVVPECYTDKDWLKNLKQYVKQGFEVDLAESKEIEWQTKENCTCNGVKKEHELFE